MRGIGIGCQTLCFSHGGCIFLFGKGLKQAQIRSRGFALIIFKIDGFSCLSKHRQRLLRATDTQGMQSGLASALVGVGCPLNQGRFGGCELLHAGCISQELAIAAVATHKVEQHGISAGRVSQTIDSPLLKIGVLNVFQEHRGIVGGGTFLEKCQEESAIGIVGALVNGSSYASAHLSSLGFASGCHNIGGESEQGIFYIRILARFGRHEHSSQLLHAFGAGSGKVVHSSVILSLGLSRHTIEHIGYHRSGGALTGILRQGTEWHECSKRQGYE